MKPFSLFIVTFVFVFSSIAQTMSSGLGEWVKDNYAVVKHTPENPYHIRVDIYLENKGETERFGEIRL